MPDSNPGPGSARKTARTQKLTGQTEELVVQTSISIYASARAEIIQHLVLRDGALLLYIGAVGAYLNVVLNAHFGDATDKVGIGYALLLVAPLPVVCLVFTLVIVQHHIMIGRIGAFLRHELRWGAIHKQISPHWDNSSSFLHGANFLIMLRLIAQASVLSLPLLYSIAFFLGYYSEAAREGCLWIALMWLNLCYELAAAIAVLGLHIYGHITRKKDWENYLAQAGREDTS